MRHSVAHRKLGRKTAHRLAMFRNMANSLIGEGRIETTVPKAKELRPLADKLVTIGKQKTLFAKRRAFDLLRNRSSVQRLFTQVAPAFAKRNGGYTRIYRLGYRAGDAAPMAMIEYLSEDMAAALGKGKVKEKGAEKKKLKIKKEAPKEAKSKAKA